MKYFYSSLSLSFVGLAIAFFIGNLEAVYICILLSILEISLSFDNAVVNARVLSNMEEKWRQRFIIYGIPIAVFGMRLVFPILIVAIASGLSLLDTLKIAIYSQDTYYAVLEESKYSIYSFGASFLLMVFLDFFFNQEREISWIKPIEDSFIVKFLLKIPNISIIISIALGLTLIYCKSPALSISYFSALLLYIAIKSVDSIFSTQNIRNGLMGFLYLEVLDASFSLDGVIGAFALSDNIFIIMLGLGIGAMFVRSLTIYLVEKNTLQKLIFLEHGAHYAILALAVIMLIKLFTDVSELITGLIGIGLIVLSLICSFIYKRINP